MYVRNKTEDVDFKVFNIITGINEEKNIYKTYFMSLQM